MPQGVLGHTTRNPLDLSDPQGEHPLETDIWTPWAIPDDDIFSTGLLNDAADPKDC